MAGNKEAHVAPYKKKVVESLVKLFREYPIVGVLDVENLPAPQLQKMRAQLRDKVNITMTKKRLMKLAIEQVKGEKKGIENLLQYMKGMPALMFTNENPFRIYNTINKSKSPAPAKPGQTAPKDVAVKAGPTPFAPGPIIGELGAVGIKTSVEGGKVAIKENAVVVKEGEAIGENMASILSRLGIEPMEIGLDVKAIYEEGIIYEKDILAFDEGEYKGKIMQAHSWAFNLAIEAGIKNTDTTEFLITKAEMESRALAREATILADSMVEELLVTAESEMQCLKSALNLPEEPAKEEIKEQTGEEQQEAGQKPEAEGSEGAGQEEKPKEGEAPEGSGDKPEGEKE